LQTVGEIIFGQFEYRLLQCASLSRKNARYRQASQKRRQMGAKVFGRHADA
jgi:hypothetical protein